MQSATHDSNSNLKEISIYSIEVSVVQMSDLLQQPEEATPLPEPEDEIPSNCFCTDLDEDSLHSSAGNLCQNMDLVDDNTDQNDQADSNPLDDEQLLDHEHDKNETEIQTDVE